MQSADIERENKAIGQLLHEARTKKGIPVTRCAERIGTNRRRYMNIEQGTAVIGVPELRALADMLDLVDDDLLNVCKTSSNTTKVVLRVRQGSNVQLILDEVAEEVGRSTSSV